MSANSTPSGTSEASTHSGMACNSHFAQPSMTARKLGFCLTTGKRGHTLAHKCEKLIVPGLNVDGVAKDEMQAIRFVIPGPHILLGRRQREHRQRGSCRFSPTVDSN